MKLLCGVGHNDKTRPAKINGLPLRQYTLWTTMLQRCYDDKLQQKQKSYIGCSVSDAFLSYTFFYDLCGLEFGFNAKDEDGKSWQLDKDLLIRGNKVYSENTCCFLPAKLNMLLQSGSCRPDPKSCGVVLTSCSTYQAQCSVNGKAVYLGTFKTQEAAYETYKKFKEGLIKRFTTDNFNLLSDKHLDALIGYIL